MKSPSQFLVAELLALGTACSAPVSRQLPVEITHESLSGLSKERKSVHDNALESIAIEILAQKYFNEALPRVKMCIEEGAGYDLDLCVQEMVVPFVRESTPELDSSVHEEIIRIIRIKFLEVKMPEPKRRSVPIDEDETMV